MQGHGSWASKLATQGDGNLVVVVGLLVKLDLGDAPSMAKSPMRAFLGSCRFDEYKTENTKLFTKDGQEGNLWQSS